MTNEKRPKKRYGSESEIMDEIHRIKADQNRLTRESIRADNEYKAFNMIADSERTDDENREGYRQEGIKRLDASKELAASASRRDAMLKTMGQKLAAFQTQPMEFMHDASVV